MAAPSRIADPRRVTYAQIVNLPRVRKLIDGANGVMMAMGYTEHGHRHVAEVARLTRQIMQAVGAGPRETELAEIAAHLHDIGNVISRVNHPLHGAGMAFTILSDLGMDPAEIAPVLGAIGNHEELTGVPVSRMSAALIIADKSDVHRSRVQNPIVEAYDIHDRVNSAVTSSRIEADPDGDTICLVLTTDESVASVMEYFEIFLHRMVMCRGSAAVLGRKFALSINGTRLE